MELGMYDCQRRAHRHGFQTIDVLNTNLVLKTKEIVARFVDIFRVDDKSFWNAASWFIVSYTSEHKIVYRFYTHFR